MNLLRHYRKTNQLKQWQLAEETGVSQTRISLMEKYNDLPSPRQARQLADYFGVKVEVLFPDGTQMKACSRNGEDGPPLPEYIPMRPKRAFPREFTVLCGHCRSRIVMATDDIHQDASHDPCCPSCGSVFYDIIPLQQAVTL